MFATQALLYCATFFFGFVFTAILSILNNYKGRLHPPLVYFAVMFLSLVGFFNASIYIRPRYVRYRQKQQLNPPPAAPALTVTPLFPRMSAFFNAVSVYAEEDEMDEELGSKPTIRTGINNDHDETGINENVDDGRDKNEGEGGEAKIPEASP